MSSDSPVPTVPPTHRPTDAPSHRRTDAPSSDVLVRVEGVRKKFCRSLKRSLLYGLRDMAGELAGGDRSHETLRKDEFWAVDNVSFELRRGECLGLIGRNGAGKTTLLKMLNGLIKPDAGQITMHGRVGALIALGAGFNPILTGRENIYVNASVLGLTKAEVDAKMEEIIDFADIGEFIDTPVQSYSSGMQVRLGFAVATALAPDVLILDEILAVGDRSFQIKCLTRVGQHLKSAAVVFVGHQMERVAQVCTTAMVLNKGQNAYIGDVSRGIEEYNRMAEAPHQSATTLASGIAMPDTAPRNYSLKYGEPCRVRLSFQSENSETCIIRIVFVSSCEEVLAEWNSTTHGLTYKVHPGANTIDCTVPHVLLRPGRYRGNVLLQPLGSSAYLVAANGYLNVALEHQSYGCYPVQF